MITVMSSFSKSSVFKMFSVHTKSQSRRLFEELFRKVRVRDGLVWTVGLNRRNKAAFSKFSAVLAYGDCTRSTSGSQNPAVLLKRGYIMFFFFALNKKRRHSSAHRCSQATCQLVQTSYIKRIKLFLFAIH